MKKLLSVLLSLVLVMSLLTGCGDKKSDTTDAVNEEISDAAGEEGTDTGEVEATAVATVGPDDATHFEMWSFVELHNTFYAGMLEKWNKANPDRQIQITFTTYPYADMHNKLTLANQSGTGAPDLCDVEIGQFPNFLQGEVPFYPLNDAIEPYKKDIVQARLDIYSKDGKYYGAPTHVGATVMYYNTEILKKYGIDYTTIKTWADFTKAGEELNKASAGKVHLTSVDTAGVDWLWIAMAEYGEDWTGGEGGSANVKLESVKKMLSMQQDWLKSGVAMISPGGHVDLEEGFQNIIDGNIAAFPKAMWYMSRFLNYMPEMKGKWAIAPCPVFEEGQNRSVGIGGTGTIVSNQCKDPELAADFLCYAKLSHEGNVGIWETLGFDTCNTSIWTDESITKDMSNKYLAYFVTNPFDTLNEIKDEIGKISVVKISPTINEQMCNITLNQILEEGKAVDEALSEAQDVIELEE
ncbi:MAG TPA: extracellular solute-binding protein [Lachnospiraceae bacterium]|nr:extracellular solute-binding protein [Lachnospiraceae bacterium]